MRRRDGRWPAGAAGAAALAAARSLAPRPPHGRATAGAPRPHAALPARPRRAPRRAPSSGGTSPASCSAARRAAPRLPDHLLPQPHRPGRRHWQPLRGAPAAVRPCRADRPGRAARTCMRSASRAGRATRRRAGPRLDARHRPARSAAGRCSAHDEPAAACTARSSAPRRTARLRAGARAARHPAAAAAGRGRLLAQGAGRSPGQPLLQRAAAGGARHAAAATARALPVRGRAWLDHEWSDAAAAPRGGGLGLDRHEPGRRRRAHRLPPAPRRRQQRCGPAAASRAGGALQVFDAGEVRFTPGRRWPSPATGARYPVQWTVDTPAGRFEVRALLDAQELDSRGSTGTVYWEGLSELLDAQRPARRAAATWR